MLTIPDEIKRLLNQDSCYKNIRIHFPNGERSDICNDQIVMNSVSFTESLCSQDTLKFGLCEAPTFECEVVGVSNVKGATIEVSCEVYCDGSVTDAEWKADLEHYVYAIPYGTFIIDECKRQADILHRKIVAYGGTATFGSGFNNELEILKDNQFPNAAVSSLSYNPNAFLLSLTNININTPPDNVFSSVDCTLTNNSNDHGWLVTYNGNDAYVKIYTREKRFYADPYPKNTLYHATGTVLKDVISSIKETIINWLKSRSVAVSSSLETSIELLFKYWDVRYDNLNGSTYETAFFHGIPFLFYPYFCDKGGRIGVTYEITKVQILSDSSAEATLYAELVLDTEFITDISFKALTAIDSYFNTFSIQFSSYAYSPFSGGTKTQRKFIPPQWYDSIKYLTSMVELLGMFGSSRKPDSIEFINIKQRFGLLPANNLYPNNTLYPEGVTGGKLLPEDYQSCWYDDDYKKPFRAIQCSYKDSSNNDCLFILYLTGFSGNTPVENYQVYNLSDNFIIQNSKWTEAQIETFCNAIAANISGVTYMPVEFVGRGLPYVEAGDTFEILTGSNDSITTIVLRRTLSGEMVLTDSYKSV